MAMLSMMVISLLVLQVEDNNVEGSSLNRNNFPSGFIFGASSSAYQFEGAYKADGKGRSIWDTFTHDHPEKISDRSNGTVATDLYHRFKDDIKLMKEIGLDSFRFSISWPRIVPTGKISGGVNKLGIGYYNDFINELLHNGIKPLVTLFHWDVPQALEDEYGGFLSHRIVDDYRDYVDVCFREFGDRVKYWVTVNEPDFFSAYGYANGKQAPGRCSNYIGNCTAGNSATEPYIVGHNIILSHLQAVILYRNKYQACQGGVIGMTVSSSWMIPFNQTQSNLKAASRYFNFATGWFLDPITVGEYPSTMRTLVGNRLPKFTKDQSEKLKHSFDFLGLNYYTTAYAQLDDSIYTSANFSYTTDSRATLSTEKNGVPIGEPTALYWIHIYPKGLWYALNYIKNKYGNPPVIITENGMADSNNYSLPLAKALQDYQRIKYHKVHLSYLNKAIKEGANVKGYFVWSFLDDFEWDTGYTYRFGMNFVDFKNGLTRYKKASAIWFQSFLNKQHLGDDQVKHKSI